VELQLLKEWRRLLRLPKIQLPANILQEIEGSFRLLEDSGSKAERHFD